MHDTLLGELGELSRAFGQTHGTARTTKVDMI